MGAGCGKKTSGKQPSHNVYATLLGAAKQKRTNNVSVELVGFQQPGLQAKIDSHLASGQPILFPCPSPGPYALIASVPAVTNEAKGRPGDQSVARLVGSLDEVVAFLDMSADGLKVANHNLDVERMTCLLPVQSSAFVADAINHRCSMTSADSLASDTSGRRASTRVDTQRRGSCEGQPYALFYKFNVPIIDELCSQERPLYISSANAHGHKMAQTIHEAVRQFETVTTEKPFRLLAIDADELRDSCKHESTSMVRVNSDGEVKSVREGYHHFPENWESKRWRLTEEDRLKWTFDKCCAI